MWIGPSLNPEPYAQLAIDRSKLFNCLSLTMRKNTWFYVLFSNLFSGMIFFCEGFILEGRGA
jgi:hypothetical protein